MSLLNSFGYANRHRFQFDKHSKRGVLKLWSSYNGSYIPQDPVNNKQGQWTEFYAQQSSRSGGNFCIDIPVGKDKDLFFLLAAIYCLKHGKEVSFENYEERTISFHITHEGNDVMEVYHVKIQYNTNAGKLIHKEILQLEYKVITILMDIGFSKEEIISEANDCYFGMVNQIDG